jgi:3-hydroxyacyl-[acyl-carrier-protein] dehydratase
MVLKDFYTILDRSGPEHGTTTAGKPFSKYGFSLELNPDHLIYQGHFKGSPVVPGVCQIQMISELLTEVIGKPLRLIQADNVKFFTPVVPGTNRLLSAELEIRDGENGTYALQSALLYENITFIKFKGIYGSDL